VGGVVPDPSLTPDRPEYYVQTGSMFENPHGVPHDEIVAMLLELPSEVAAQVIFGKYVESSGLVFSGELIQMMIDRSLPRVTGDYWFDQETVDYCKTFGKVHGRDALKSRFHTGIDFARQTDFTVIFGLDTRLFPARVCYYKRLNRVPWESIYREVGRALALFGPSALGDSTGMAGDVIFDALESRYYCVVHDRNAMVADPGCRDRNGQALPGCKADDHIMLGTVDRYPFSSGTKMQLIEHLRSAMSKGYRNGSEEPFGALRVPPIVQVEEEASFYAWDDKGLETDTIMSLALAAWQGLEDAPAPAVVGSNY
jgi:hypothetical protein